MAAPRIQAARRNPPAPTASAPAKPRAWTDFAIEKITAQVNPDQNQKDLLDALKVASVKAVGILQNACPGELPSTPTGRLAAMLSRVDTMLKAVETVRPASTSSTSP